MDEMTEEAAFGGLLTIHVGGKPVELRVLTIEESDAWQRRLGATLGALDVPEATADGGEMLGNMLVAGAAAKLEMVLAYDVEGRLGDREAVRKRMTKRELQAAFEMILDAEDPKEEDANRSVVEAFGRQMQMVQVGLRVVAQTAASYQPASSTNGHSPTGDLTPVLSAAGSPARSSSSSGPTARNARRAR